MRIVGLLATLLGCGPTVGTPTCGIDSIDYFPFDGTRVWEYYNTDPLVTFKLIGLQLADSTKLGDVNLYDIEHRVDCVSTDPSCVDDRLLRTTRWSSDGQDGTMIHQIIVDGLTTTFDPPILFAEDKVCTDDIVDTATSAGTFSVTYMGIEPCPLQMTVDWECMRFTVDDGGSSAVGPSLNGDYWFSVGYNLVALDLASDVEGRWEAGGIDCEPIDSCDGIW